MNNMEIYGKLSTPPKEALKKITGGRLSGMTDINPQWRYEALTDAFGPCGIGWKYEVSRIWLEPASDEQVAAFAMVNFYFKQNEKWSEAVPGVGGSLFIAKEKSGLRTSDEAYKMAITDALSVALKMIGVAADIYAGRFDGSKYKPTTPLKTTIKHEPVVQGDRATIQQVKALYEIAKKNDMTNKELDQLANWYKTGPRITEKEAAEMIKDFDTILTNYLDYLETLK